MTLGLAALGLLALAGLLLLARPAGRTRRQTLMAPGGLPPSLPSITPPAPPTNLEIEFVIPLLIALAGALIAGLVTTLLAYVWEAPRPDRWGITMGGLTLAGLFTLLVWHRQRVLWRVEKLGGVDLNHDTYQGEPPDAAALLENAARSRQQFAAQKRQAADQQLLDTMLAFYRKCLELDASGRQQTTEEAHNVTPATRPNYVRRRTLLMELGIAEWRDARNRRLGWTVSPLQALAEEQLRLSLRAKVQDLFPALPVEDI